MSLKITRSSDKSLGVASVVPTNTEHIQIYCKLRIYSLTLCDITTQIVTHRVDWFSCLAFVLLQYTPARPPNLIF